MKAGDAVLEVVFEVDVNGILKVTATEKSSGRSANITISNSVGKLSSTEIESMISGELYAVIRKLGLVLTSLQMLPSLRPAMKHLARSLSPDNNSKLTSLVSRRWSPTPPLPSG